jgi:hypothetical protein
MSKRQRVYLGLLVALLLGLLLYVLGKATRYEETVEHGPAPEARSNPYLAAEHFLLDQGRVVTHAEHLGELTDTPPENQVLLMLDARTNMTPTQTEALLQWVEEGGHLVFVAEQIWDEKAGRSGDLLLDALNLQQYETPKSQDETANGDARREPTPALTRLFLEDEDAPAYIAFDTDYHLYDAGKSAFAWANSDRATHMLQLRRGSGLITALTDSWIWQNENIGRHDHAWLLWYLTQDRDVTLTYRTDHEGLLQRLLRYFPEALTALLLMALITLWHVGQRQGPLIEATERGRRQLREHLRGSADFLYRRAGQGHLLTRLQQDIHRQAQRRHPGFASLAYAEQCQVLATLSRASSETVAEAMRPAPKRSLGAAEFTRQVACLHSLRNAL